MKKVLALIAIVGLVACGTAEDAAKKVDSTATEVKTAVDTTVKTVVDSTVKTVDSTVKAVDSTVKAH